MSKTAELLELYTDVLATFGVEENQSGTLTLTLGDAEIPLEIDGLPLVMPTARVLDTSPWKSCVAFHPLCENTYRDESPVIEKLRSVSLVRLNGLFGILLKEIAELASAPEHHAKLTPAQKIVLTMLPEADEKFYAVVKQLGGLLNTSSEHRFISMYLRRNHSVERQVYYRAAVVTFPLLMDLIETPTQVWGVKLRVKDAKMLRAFLTYALPRSDELDMYTVGSNSEVAPTFDALVKAHIGVVKELNKVVSTFPEIFEGFKGAQTSTRVFDRLGDYTRYKGLIPVLPGNDGESLRAPAPTPAREETPAPRNDKPASRGFKLNVAEVSSSTPKPQVQSHRTGDDGSDWQRIVDERARREYAREHGRGRGRDRDYGDRDRDRDRGRSYNDRDRDYEDRGRGRDYRDRDYEDRYVSRPRAGRYDTGGRGRNDRDRGYNDRDQYL